ncbi:ThiF family adenylyltransferase [Celeribacter sp. ULVN23_4]
MSRYVRQTCLPEIGPEGQARLAAAKVLVAGAGGLGSVLLPLLAGAGVGTITVYDPDSVEESNLHRQTLYRMDDLGKPKAEIAQRHLRALNPDCNVQAKVARLDPITAQQEIDAIDLVIDAADSFAASYALSDLCQRLAKPLISASVLGRQGYVGGFCGTSPSLRAVFPAPPAVAANCATAGVMGPTVATLGAIQAQMALSVLLHHAPSPLGQLLSVDFATWRMSQFTFDGAEEPDEIFPEIIAQGQISKADILVDLREHDGIDATQAALAPERRVVFLCTSGLRAWRAAKLLTESGHGRVAICAVGA